MSKFRIVVRQHGHYALEVEAPDLETAENFADNICEESLEEMLETRKCDFSSTGWDTVVDRISDFSFWGERFAQIEEGGTFVWKDIPRDWIEIKETN